MALIDGGTMPTSNFMQGGVSFLQNAGAPSAGTTEVQTITISNFGAHTLRLGFMGSSADVVFTGSEDNTAIDVAVTAALEGMNTIGSGNVTVAVTGTTNRAIAVTFAGALDKLVVPLITASVSGGGTVQATLSTALAGDNNDLVYTAVTGGTAGNSITIAYVDPSGNDAALGIVVTGTDIVVNLATGSGGAITSTADDIKAAIALEEDAAALVTVADKASNDGSGVVIALAETALAGGLGTESVAVVETTPGVTATGRGAAKGSKLIDTTNGKEYINEGTAYAPVWNSVGDMATADIANGAVTLAKMADLAQDKVIGRTTASTGVPETFTVTAAARSVLDDTTVGAMVDTIGGAAATGTGGLVRKTDAALVTPNIGTPSAGVLTNCTGLPTAGLVNGAVTSAKLANGAGLGAVITAGLGNSASYLVTANGVQADLLALKAEPRAAIFVVVVDEVFANGDGGQPTFKIGETDTDDKFAGTAKFTNAAAGAVFVFAGTITTNKAVIVTAVAGSGTATGGISVTVLALDES